MLFSFKKRLLKTLESIESTLNRIEKSVEKEKQQETICNVFSHSLNGSDIKRSLEENKKPIHFD